MENTHTMERTLTMNKTEANDRSGQTETISLYSRIHTLAAAHHHILLTLIVPTAPAPARLLCLVADRNLRPLVTDIPSTQNGRC